MIAIVVVAHVPLASALVACARHVLGHEPEVEVADILPNECASDCAPNLAQQLIAADQGEGVLVLTDLPGATPSNIAFLHALQHLSNGLSIDVEVHVHIGYGHRLS